MYYGFATALAQYGRGLCPKPIPEFDDISYMTIALDHLRYRTGIKTIALQTVYLRPDAPPDTRFEVATSGAKVVTIVSILSSRSFKHIPTQAAVKHVSQLIGGKQALWWTSTL